jgi:hypothetical protein
MNKLIRDIKIMLVLIAGIMIGGIGMKSKMTPTWESQQLKLGTNMISPISNESLLMGQVYAQEAPTPTPTPDPIQLAKEEIRRVFGDKAEEAIKVFTCEGLRSNRCNDGLNKDGSVDCGVAQINTIHGISRKWLLNYKINIAVAKQIYDEHRNWSAWYSSKSCHHLD